MIFGEPDRFAIRCEVEDSGPRFGFVTILTGGIELGAAEREVYAATTLSFLQHTLSFEGHRSMVDCFLPVAEALRIIGDGFFSSAASGKGAFSRAQDFEPYIVSPYGSPNFDGWLVVLIECLEHDRLIWKHFVGNTLTGEVLLKKGEYRKAVTAAVDWGQQTGLLKP